MWALLWRYVIVPALVALLTWSVADHRAERRNSDRVERVTIENHSLRERIAELREALRRREESDDDRRPFRPRGLGASAVGAEPAATFGEPLRVREWL